MTTTVTITTKVNELIDEQRGEAGKEGFVHCVLLLALADDRLVAQATALNTFFENSGSDVLEKHMGQ